MGDFRTLPGGKESIHVCVGVKGGGGGGGGWDNLSRLCSTSIFRSITDISLFTDYTLAGFLRSLLNE